MPAIILKQQKLVYSRKWYQTTCFKCKTEFKSTQLQEDRFWIRTQYYLRCPCCSEHVVISSAYPNGTWYKHQTYSVDTEIVDYDSIKWYNRWKLWFGDWEQIRIYHDRKAENG